MARAIILRRHRLAVTAPVITATMIIPTMITAIAVVAVTMITAIAVVAVTMITAIAVVIMPTLIMAAWAIIMLWAVGALWRAVRLPATAVPVEPAFVTVTDMLVFMLMPPLWRPPVVSVPVVAPVILITQM
jgi:hypothetical protein